MRVCVVNFDAEHAVEVRGGDGDGTAGVEHRVGDEFADEHGSVSAQVGSARSGQKFNDRLAGLSGGIGRGGEGKVRAFPDAGHRLARGLAELTSSNTDDARGNDRRVRVFVPWKAMILGSVVLTIVVNLVLLIT